MKWMGQTLTLLILIMSICFFVISIMVGATHRNWKEAATKANQIASSATARLDEAKTQTGEKQKLLAAEKFSRAMQIAQLESQLKRANEEYRAKEEQLRKETELGQQLISQLEQSEKRLAQQDQEVAGLKAGNSKLVDEIADKFAMVQNLTNQQFELGNRLEAVEQLNQDLTENLAVKDRIMKANGLTDTDFTDDITPPIDAFIVKVSDRGDAIGISAGTDDGLRVGHEFDIYRSDRYVGKLVITRVDHDVSVGRIIKDFMKDRVREGDHVTSKF